MTARSSSSGRQPSLVWRDAAVVMNGRIVDKFVGRKDVKGLVYLGDRVSFRYYDMCRER